MLRQYSLRVDTTGRGTIDVTAKVAALVRDSGIGVGLAHLFVHHTSASLLVSENADRLALGTWQGIYLYEHRTAPHRRRLTLTVHGE